MSPCFVLLVGWSVWEAVGGWVAAGGACLPLHGPPAAV